MKIIRTEKQIESIADEITDALPLGMDEEWRDKSVHFTVDGIISRQIESAYRAISYSQQKLDDAMIKLFQADKDSNGSEVSDTRLQRATEWSRTMEAQLDFTQRFYENDMRSAQAAYLAYFGKKWVPYSVSRNIAAAKRETAAALEAKEVERRYEEQQETRKPLY